MTFASTRQQLLSSVYSPSGLLGGCQRKRRGAEGFQQEKRNCTYISRCSVWASISDGYNLHQMGSAICVNLYFILILTKKHVASFTSDFTVLFDLTDTAE